MKLNKLHLIFSFLLFASFLPAQQIKEYTNPAILSFESGVSPAIAGANSQLSVSREHYKHLTSSLEWKWTAPNAQWKIAKAIGYAKHNQDNDDTSVSTFIFWIYNSNPVKDGRIKVEFLKDGHVCCFFEYGVDFTGWRGAWIAFDRDMQGKPQEGMNEMRITGPSTSAGQLFFDHIILSSFQDSRQHTADFQAPFINKATENHWLVLLNSWNQSFDLPIEAQPTVEQQNGVKQVSERLTDLLLRNRKSQPVRELISDFNRYQIRKNRDGSLRGLPVFFERHGEAYERYGAPNYTKIYNNAMGISKCNQLLYNMAVTYHKSNNADEKSTIAKMYVLLMRHLMDQGFQAGSAMGTLHHLGYSMRNFYTAAFLMQQALREAQLDQPMQQAMEWFAGTGEIKIKPSAPGMDIDAFNTSLLGRLTSILMMNDSPEKIRYLHAFSRWIDNGLMYSPGTGGSFKVDGSIFHHRHNYPAYAVGGLDGAVYANYLLANTAFQLQPVGRENLKKALLTMRIYSNLLTWPLSQSGRHPDGTGHINPEHFAMLALTGTPDYSQPIDAELAGAYMRLVNDRPTKYAAVFKKAGVLAELPPNGNWSFNYSCLNVHRRDNWSVTASGHSRYLWATEIYQGANLYGRYLNHGNLQIQASGHPVSNFESGFNQHGWDWNHFPGTTAAVLPLKELRADVRNVDTQSGYEEMLLSDEAFAGGISIENRQGAFGMKLHEHDKYNGSLRARKSYFFFDNRVVALGSDIRSALPGKNVNTTLFQVYLPQTDVPFNVNGTNNTEFPYSAELKKGMKYLSDSKNNYFFVKQGDVMMSKSLQHSLDEESDKPTKNNFALAFIDHGTAPKGASYEYMILIQPTADELNSTVRKLAGKNDAPYVVLQQDSSAHIVFDKSTRTTGYVLFNAGKQKVDAEVAAVNVPCMIMTADKGANQMAFSVCDPDLRFYEGKADELYDAQGKRIERSIYSRKWIDNESGKSVVEITLKGAWKLKTSSEFVAVKPVSMDQTVVQVLCQHGIYREFTLEK